MKKIFSLLLLMVFGCSFAYAGPWVVGVNQVLELFDKIEAGCEDCDVPPSGDNWRKGANEEGHLEFYTDLKDDENPDKDWTDVPGITIMEDNDENKALVTEAYSSLTNNLGIVGIDFANKNYKQKEGTTIQLIQVGMSWDYERTPDGYKSLDDYLDRYDIRWLETIDFSGNDFHSIEISGGLYQLSNLKTLNLSDNPNLTYLSVTNCANLELVDVRGTGLSETELSYLELDIKEYSPNAVILTGPSSIKEIDASAIVVSLSGNTISIKNKTANDQVQVYDPYGRLMLQSYAETVNVSSLAAGVYLVKVNNQVTKVLKK